MKTSKYEVEEEIAPVYVPNASKYRFGTGQNGLCKFNDGVCCEMKEKDNCWACGWNPVVAQKRLVVIIEELSKRWRYINPTVR